MSTTRQTRSVRGAGYLFALCPPSTSARASSAHSRWMSLRMRLLSRRTLRFRARDTDDETHTSCSYSIAWQLAFSRSTRRSTSHSSQWHYCRHPSRRSRASRPFSVVDISGGRQESPQYVLVRRRLASLLCPAALQARELTEARHHTDVRVRRRIPVLFVSSRFCGADTGAAATVLRIVGFVVASYPIPAGRYNSLPTRTRRLRRRSSSTRQRFVAPPTLFSHPLVLVVSLSVF